MRIGFHALSHLRLPTLLPPRCHSIWKCWQKKEKRDTNERKEKPHDFERGGSLNLLRSVHSHFVFLCFAPWKNAQRRHTPYSVCERVSLSNYLYVTHYACLFSWVGCVDGTAYHSLCWVYSSMWFYII